MSAASQPAAATPASAAYYAEFRRKHGFADNLARGHGFGRKIVLHPIGDVIEGNIGIPDRYTAHGRTYDLDGRDAAHGGERSRAEQLERDSATEIRLWIACNMPSIKRKIEMLSPKHAVRQALEDAHMVCAGRVPARTESNLVTLHELKKILTRYI